jgi:uncharacterized tellurite resistance protein B-like protein
MRPYPHNSPEAASRIVALTMLADGHLSRVELEALQRGSLQHAFDLAPAALHGVIQALCEDLLATAHASRGLSHAIDMATLQVLLTEVDDPELQARVLRTCIDVAEADTHLAEGEAVVLLAVAERWGQQQVLRQAAQ